MLHRALAVIVSGILGSAVGVWVYSQGFGALPCLLLAIITGPFIIGLILRRRVLVASLIFNVAVVAALHIRIYVWETAHGIEAAGQATEHIPFSVVLLLVSCGAATLSLVAHRLRIRGEARS